MMSAMKRFLEDCIEELSRKTGYDSELLMYVWFKCMEDGIDWEAFEAMTLDHNW